MGYDDEYGARPESRQLQIGGLGLEGERDVREAAQWAKENPEAYGYMVENALRLSKKGYVSANYLVNMVRNELHVKVKNGYAPALARLMSRNVPGLKGAFKTHASRSDGYV